MQNGINIDVTKLNILAKGIKKEEEKHYIAAVGIEPRAPARKAKCSTTRPSG